MDVDEVFDKIGDLGTAQKKIVFPLNLLVHTFSAFNILIISFIGLDPDWSCTESAGSSTKKPQLLYGSVDPKACELYEAGQCDPVFEDKFTSIVTSVSFNDL